MENQIALWNFNLDNEGDRMLYELCKEHSKGLRGVIEDAQKKLHAPPPDRTPLGTDPLSKLVKHLEEEKDNLWREILKKHIEYCELAITLKALDAKVSELVKQMREPWPGFFAHVGVGADHPLLNPPPWRPQKPHLTLVKQ